MAAETKASSAEFRFAHTAVTVRWAGATHPGLRRSVNEDSVFAAFPVFLVADGMGGHAAGDVASAVAIEAFRGLRGRALADVDAVERSIADAFGAVRAQPGAVGGSTLAGAVLVDMGEIAHWYVVNVGDSRVYLIERGELQQLSVDHSLVQELVDAGEMAAGAARRHRDRHVITRALGAGQESAPDLWALPAERGQRLLVCSDGLTGELLDREIAWILSLHASPAAAADALVSAALDRGARDNVSVIVADVDDVGHSDASFHDTAGAIDADTIPRSA